MIVQWKQEGPILHHAEWLKMQLDLAWDYDTSRWRCWVDGKRVKQHWDSVTAAKAGVDAIVSKLLSNGPVVPMEKYGASKIEAALPRLHALTTLCALATMDLERRTAHA